jgi:hypothetical protein
LKFYCVLYFLVSYGFYNNYGPRGQIDDDTESIRESVSDWTGPTMMPPAAAFPRHSTDILAAQGGGGLGGISKEGFLMKQGFVNVKMRRRWFRLTGHHLDYYRHFRDPAPRGSINIDWAKVSIAHELFDIYPFCFYLYTPKER